MCLHAAPRVQARSLLVCGISVCLVFLRVSGLCAYGVPEWHCTGWGPLGGYELLRASRWGLPGAGRGSLEQVEASWAGGAPWGRWGAPWAGGAPRQCRLYVAPLPLKLLQKLATTGPISD